MEKTYYVYRHICPNGMIYVGFTTNPKRRWSSNGHEYHKNTLFGQYIEMYGWNNIIHEIIYTCYDKKEALQVEDEMICYYREKGLCLNSNRSGCIKSANPKAYSQSKNAEYLENHREERRIYCSEYNENHREERRIYYKEYEQKRKITPERIVYCRVREYNRCHKEQITITPLQAKQDYLNFGIIPDFIKNDDIPPRQISA